jgi:arabinose-5-phosphate isomerase
LQCKGHVVVVGVGKSGHVAGKIAATLSSTGTPAFFVHPADAGHGDIGMIKQEDLLLAVSNSGEAREINEILPPLKRLGVKLIAMTGNAASTLARHADIHLDVSVEKEACTLDLAPTSSTTAALVMGDALAVALLQARGFTREDFARSHPAGRLGRKLLLHIGDIMHSGADIPQVNTAATISETILEITRKRMGMSAVLDADGKVVGVYTDGDLRRTLDAGLDIHTTPIGTVMTRVGKSIGPQALATEAAHLMEVHKIQGLLVIDDDNQLVGVLNFQDLLKAGVV